MNAANIDVWTQFEFAVLSMYSDHHQEKHSHVTTAKA